MTQREKDLVVGAAWLFVIGCILLAIVLSWIFIFGPMLNQVIYNNYQSSPQHLQAVAGKLTDDCTQLALAKDPVSKKAIERDIAQQASTVDLAKVDMPSSVRACVDAAINDTTSNP